MRGIGARHWVAGGAAAALLCASARAQQGDAGRLVVTRHDLYEVVDLIDLHFAAGHRLEASGGLTELARTNDEFDRISRLFLGGQLSRAMRALAAMEAAIEPNGGSGAGADPGIRADVRIDERWCRIGRVDLSGRSEFELRVRSLWPRADLAGQTLAVDGRSADVDLSGHPDRGRTAAGEVRFDPKGRAVLGEVRLPIGARRGAAVQVRVGGEPVPGPSLFETELGADFRGRAAALARDDAAARAFGSRADLNLRAPSMDRSAEFLLVGSVHVQETREELAALERGDDPFRLRRGDHWRTFAHGRRDLAARVDYPASAPEDSIPLVLAFHGAGADENFFFALAGDGHLFELAQEVGCLVVTPFTPDYLFSTKAFDSLLAGIAEDYPIDPERVFLFGHSLGAMTIAKLCAERPERIAAACCVAGFRSVPESSPPLVVIQGARDSIVPRGAVRSAVEASEGADVSYVEFADQGHTLLLAEALDLAFSRWFQD